MTTPAVAVVPGAVVAPRDGVELRTLRIWEEVAGRRASGVGEPLDGAAEPARAGRLLARIEEDFEVELPAAVLEGAATLADLAGRVAAAGRRDPDGWVVPLALDGELPLSFAQQRLWFFDRLRPGNPAYNIPAAVRLFGAVSAPALAAAFAGVVDRHEVLRTTFDQLGGEPVQVVHPRPAVALPVIDLADLPAPDRARATGRLVAADAARGFDLLRGPLCRFRLLRLTADEHLLLLNFHHIVADGWSVAVVVRELSALYRAALAGEPSPLPELPLQYADFARWQRRWLAGEVLERELAHWQERIGTAPTALELPADRPRPPAMSFRGAALTFTVPAEVVGPLRAVGRRHGATLFMALATGFAALLARRTGEERLLLGLPIANRNRAEIEGLIGFFVNTLVLVADLAGDPPLVEALARLRDAAVDAYAHQDLPFEKLVERLQPERDAARTPLVQVLFQLVNTPREDLALPGLAARAEEPPVAVAKTDLGVNLFEDGDAVVGMCIYSTDLFDRSTVERLMRHFVRLLGVLGAEPETRLSAVELLSPAERQQVEREWSDTAAAYPLGRTLPEWIAGQAAATPDATAVVYDGAHLSYRELLARARRLAGELRRRGAGPNERVAVCLERSLELVIALVAAVEAGAAYLPLDPEYPSERLGFVLAESAPVAVVTTPRLAALLPAHGVPVVDPAAAVAGDGDGGDVESELDARRPLRPDDLAYVIYTSGSTGRPKGVANHHRGIVNRLVWMQERYGLTPADRVLQKTPYSFDVSVWEFFWPLMVGATLVVARPGGHRDSAYLAGVIAREGVTTLHFVPSMLQAFVVEPRIGECTSLRRVMASGEALPAELVARFFGRVSGRMGCELHNLYGPTEAAVDVTFWACAPDADRRSIPIGRPVANTAIRIVDRRLRPVPVGVAGELLIGGVQPARGYLGRPGLTAERFVPDPFAQACEGRGARLYRTGDLARHLPGGEVEFLGRLDHQVKLRGFRIELGEIEAVLATHPEARECAVAALPARAGAAGGDLRLVAYVALPSEEGTAAGRARPHPSSPALRDHLLARLPEYMVPAAFVALDALPLTGTGKVDRRALPAPEAVDSPAPAAELVPPRDELERRLAGLWTSLLGVERVGIHDRFFDVGGDSIRGAILINQLQAALGEIVHVVVLFDTPTVAGLAAGTPPPLAEADFARFAALAATPARAGAGGAKNPPAVFVLAPPRSGTTLLRVILGGHPRLFAPPELELLGFATMTERKAAFSGPDAFFLEGLLRAVVELRGCDPDEARAIVAEAEEEGWTTARMYGRLQEWLGDRLLVDKTPTYALDPTALARAEEGFAGARYVHLIRHPAGMVRSFAKASMQQVFFRRDHPYSPRQLAELFWTVSHRNIERFLAGVPAERRVRVRFEDLVRRPRPVVEEICGALGLELVPAMLDPYGDRRGRMTDGLRAESRMLGDVKFHQHSGIEAGVADDWRREGGGCRLGEPTWRLAEEYGYPREEGADETAAATTPAPPAGRTAALVRLAAGEAPPLVLVHGAGGGVLPYADLAQRLAGRRTLYAVQAADAEAGGPPPESLGEMAEDYLARLRAVVPSGPYLLGGWSMGGVVALEMARRLHAEGEEVALLALFDAWLPASVEALEGRDEAAALWIGFARGLGLSLADLAAVRDRLVGAAGDEERLAILLERARAAGLLPEAAGLPRLRALFALHAAHLAAFRAYAAAPWPGRALLVQAVAGAGEAARAAQAAAWREVVGEGLATVALPGHHYSLLRPPVVAEVVARLEAGLSEVEAEREAAVAAGGGGDGEADR